MILNNFVVGVVAAGCVILVASSPQADDYLDAVIREVPQAAMYLAQALKLGEREGVPISAEYDVEDGNLQISVYLKAGNQFREAIVDPISGSIVTTKPLIDPKEITEAEAESAAVDRAKLPLEAALAAAVTANEGYRAVSVIPMLGDNESVAAITLINNEGLKQVTEKLD